MWYNASEILPPKGESVICYGINDYGKGRTMKAFYAPRYEIEDGNEYDAAEYDEEKDEYFLKEGWYENNEHDEVNWMIDFPVTHWMTLPEPPQ